MTLANDHSYLKSLCHFQSSRRGSTLKDTVMHYPQPALEPEPTIKSNTLEVSGLRCAPVYSMSFAGKAFFLLFPRLISINNLSFGFQLKH